MGQVLTTFDVLTLAEAARYLRLSKRTVERLAQRDELPGRPVAQGWRFLKPALDDWLRGRDGRTSLLRQAGALAGDDTLVSLRDAVYVARGRPEAE